MEVDDTAESMAITKAAMEGRVEEISPHMKSLDVVANQIAGMVMDFGEVGTDKILRILQRTYPFKDLRIEELQRVVDQIGDYKLVWREKGSNVLKKRRKSWEYYYENLSMIPDERKYEIYDIVSGRSVGMLDEAFVVNFAEPGAVFITKGYMWRVVEMPDREREHGKDRIKVEPVEGMGKVPSWTGEEIPVPFEVAQDVGKLRSEIAAFIHAELDDEAIAKKLQAKYPVARNAVLELIRLLRDHVEGGFPARRGYNRNRRQRRCCDPERLFRPQHKRHPCQSPYLALCSPLREQRSPGSGPVQDQADPPPPDRPCPDPGHAPSSASAPNTLSQSSK